MKGGYRIGLKPRADVYQRSMYLTGGYEPATLALFDQVLRAGDTMVDVGANLGLMALHAASIVGPSGRVIAVEAHPGHFLRLERNIALNRFDQVTAVNCAAGDGMSDREIYDFPAVNIGRSSLVRAPEAMLAGVTHVRPLDAILGEHGIGAVALWKMDVEGFEAQVIAGAPALVARKPVICMEIVYDQPAEGGDPLAAHTLLMRSGLYDPYVFAGTKFEKSAVLRRLESERELIGFHDNVVYIAPERRATLPQSLFR